MRIFVFVLMLLINCSIAAAYTPKIFIEVSDDTLLYNPEITQKLSEKLNEKLTIENKFIITSREEAEYLIEGKIVGMGIGQLVNNPMGTAYTLSGSAASLFVSPFAGPILGGIGMMQIRKNVFAVAVQTDIIRCSDNEVVKKLGFLGKTNLKNIEMSPEVVDNTIDDAVELITKRFFKDINREEQKIFVEPVSSKNERIYIKVNQ